MFARLTTLLVTLLLGLTLAACGSPVAAAPPPSVAPPTVTAAPPTATVAPRATTTSVPVPVPSATPTSVAPPAATLVPAATLRATILAQIDAVEQRCAADPAATGACYIVPDQWKSMEQERELLGYIGWLHMPAICGEAPRPYTLALMPFTTEGLRNPVVLDSYLANRWCRSGTPTR